MGWDLISTRTHAFYFFFISLFAKRPLVHTTQEGGEFLYKKYKFVHFYSNQAIRTSFFESVFDVKQFSLLLPSEIVLWDCGEDEKIYFYKTNKFSAL